MDQDRNPLDVAGSEPFEGTSIPDDFAQKPGSGHDAESPGTMRLYAQVMHRHPLLKRDQEVALAAEIENRSRALWTTLLSHPSMAAEVARLVAVRFPAARQVLRQVERAGAPLRGDDAREALDRAAGKASEKLHLIDVDHRVADEVAGLIAAAARDPARAPDPLRARARTRAFAAFARSVAEAARAVADARARFVHANIGLVFFVAGRYRSTGLSLADFVQEGMFGLMKAVDRFDHRRGHRFSTYATWWIRHAIGRALSEKGRLVRLPVHLQEARQRLDGVARDLRRELQREPTREELARAAGMTPARLDHIREVNSLQVLSLDAPIGEREDRLRSEVLEHPAEQEPDPGESLAREALARAALRHLKKLSPLEEQVLRRRFALGGVDRAATLQEIAVDVGLSRERIRQIQASALRKLRALLAAGEDPDARAA